MRLTATLASLLLLGSTLSAQWAPLSTGMLSNLSLCAKDGDLFCATYPNGVKKSIGGTGPFIAVNTGLANVGGNYFVESVGTDGAYLYAGTESGIYRSGDNGDQWDAINGSLTANANVYANKFFSVGGNILAVFAGSVAEGGGIWRSSNFGNTWLIGHSGMGSNVVVYHLTQVGGTLWASTSVGLYTSTDNAQNWTPHPSVNYTVYSLASLNSTLVAVTTFGIRYSTNGGGTWMDATGDPSAPTDGEIIAFDGQLYALLSPPTGCLRSLDNGATWSAYNTGFSDVDAQAQQEFFALGNTLYCTALFDIYSITGTGNGVSSVANDPGAGVFPSVFDEGFTLRTGATTGWLLLLDATGRAVRSVHADANTDRWVPRAGLSVGTYQAVMHDPVSGTRVRVGTLIAH